MSEEQFFWAVSYDATSYVSAFALVLYEHSITLDLEVKHIWRKKFNVATIVFILNRYGLLLSLLTFVPPFLFVRGIESCNRLDYANAVFSLLHFLIFEGFFILRTWAIWGQQWLPVFVLTPFLITASALKGVQSFSQTVVDIIPIQLPYGGCDIESTLSPLMTQRIYTAATALLLVQDVLVLASTVVKTIDVKRAANRANIGASLSTLLLRDGTLYFIAAILSHALALVVAYTALDAPSISVIIGPIEVILSILVSRFILNLKQIDLNRECSVGSTGMSSVNFAWNLGAPLSIPNYSNGHGDPSANYMHEAATKVSFKQLAEDPLTIGLFDDDIHEATTRSEGDLEDVEDFTESGSGNTDTSRSSVV
ncbi:hypothetical protein C8Q75DRAFT_735712 [Abortiporus biennis]|nr:hypothetical protein C8Q75DRAFT_735712 [Abortiporus biennis]